MDITPLYELRNRLRATMIAGTNLIDEDFRLKRAVQDVKSLEKASPVFARIVQACETLTEGKSEASETMLLDTITLLDAVLCTQGVVGVSHSGDMESIKGSGTGLTLKNVPYSTFKPVMDALTTSGNGHLAYLEKIYDEQPEIFKDYRVIEGLIVALGAGYTELAEFAEDILKENGAEILPILIKDFHPKGKKEMIRRLKIIEHIAGGEANDFYAANLNESEKELRQALVYALRHNQQNTELLIDLANHEKGNTKKIAYAALACMESHEAADFFENLYKKNPVTAMEAIYLSDTKWGAKMVARCLKEQLERWKELYDRGEQIVIDKKTEELLNSALPALVGKNGKEVCELCKEVIALEDSFRIISDKREYSGYLHGDFKILGYKCNGDLFQLKDIPKALRKDEPAGFKDVISHILKLNLVINPDEELKRLVMEMQDNSTIFPATFFLKLLYDENVCEWLNKKLEYKGFLKILRGKDKKQLLEFFAKEMAHLLYDERTKEYMLTIELLDANKQWSTYSQPVAVNVKGELTDFMMHHFPIFDAVLEKCIDKEDGDYKKRLEEYFYQCALTASGDDCIRYWRALKKCGCERCDGLFVRAAVTTYDINKSKKTGIYGYELEHMTSELPGTREAKVAEVNSVLELIRNDKIRVSHIDYEELERKIFQSF